jgi:hypothetical protein
VLRAAATASLAALVPGAAAAQQGQSSQPAVGRLSEPPWWMKSPHAKSRVVDVRSESVIRGSNIDQAELDRLVSRGVQELTGTQSSPEAWRSILGSARRILLKFNSVGAEVIGTNPSLARTLVTAVTEAGYDQSGIALTEVPARVYSELKVGRPESGWGPSIPVGDRMEPVTSYLYAADAVINIGFLKTHPIAGMSASMINLSHALIRHPGLYHGNGCSPFVGQVIGNKEISARLRLNVINALRIVAKSGSDADESDLIAHGGLLLGYDPVAVDTVGLSVLALRQRQIGLTETPEVRYLLAAAQIGVGRIEPRDLEHVVQKN